MTAQETYVKAQASWKVKLSEVENQEFDTRVYGPTFSTTFNGVTIECNMGLTPNGFKYETEEFRDEFTPALTVGEGLRENVNFGFAVSMVAADRRVDKDLWTFSHELNSSDTYCVARGSGSVEKSVADLKNSYLLPGNFLHFVFNVEIAKEFFDVKSQLEKNETDKKIKSGDEYMQWFFAKIQENESQYLSDRISLLSTIDKSEHFFQLGLLIFHSPDYFEGLQKWNEVQGRKEAKLNMTGDVIKQIQYYLFNGKVSNTWRNVEMAGLVDAAKIFHLEGLLAICEKEMSLNTTEDNAIHNWHIATLYDLHIAENVAITLIGSQMALDLEHMKICPTCNSNINTINKNTLVKAVHSYLSKLSNGNRPI